jgi:hypothetical protein
LWGQFKTTFEHKLAEGSSTKVQECFLIDGGGFFVCVGVEVDLLLLKNRRDGARPNQRKHEKKDNKKDRVSNSQTQASSLVKNTYSFTTFFRRIR